MSQSTTQTEKKALDVRFDIRLCKLELGQSGREKEKRFISDICVIFLLFFLAPINLFPLFLHASKPLLITGA
jgi:hypothetical protein